MAQGLPDFFTERFFGDHVTLSAGNARHAERDPIVGPMKRGLKVAVMLGGLQTYRLDDGPTLEIAGSSLFVALNDGERMQTRHVLSDEPLRFAMLQVDPEFAGAELGAAFEGLRQRLADNGPEPGLMLAPADIAQCALAVQMIESPAIGGARRLHLAAKAIELLATVIDRLVGDQPRSVRRLSPRALEQIRAAREILVAGPREPPTLTELSRSVGLNATKLTAGFRQVFGTSVFGYLQEYRLQQAFELIRSGAMGVTEAAYHVGYTPAHFSSLFRKRFGMPPSELR